MVHRREYLATALATVLAGCSGTRVIHAPTTTPSPSASTATACTAGPDDLPLRPGNLRTALSKDRIPAIVDPAFGEDWSAVSVPDGSNANREDPTLPDDAPVVGVEHAGRARAYPLRILNWHEIVNDLLPASANQSDEDGDGTDRPLLVTYCPLCGSALAFQRRVDGEPTIFGVSGHLWCSNLVMYDRRTDSLWSQIHGIGIRGPRTGETLALLPTRLTTWAEWRASHPRTRVLLPPPWSNTVRGRDATYDYYSAKYPYDNDQIVGQTDESAHLHPRALVVGVVTDDHARAYPSRILERRGVVHDRVGDKPVVVAIAPGGTMVAYDRQVAGQPRQFVADGERYLRAGGSRWERTTGRAVDGPHRGRHLEDATGSSPMFWGAWSEFHPDTTVYSPA